MSYDKAWICWQRSNGCDADWSLALGKAAGSSPTPEGRSGGPPNVINGPAISSLPAAAKVPNENVAFKQMGTNLPPS